MIRIILTGRKRSAWNITWKIKWNVIFEGRGTWIERIEVDDKVRCQATSWSWLCSSKDCRRSCEMTTLKCREKGEGESVNHPCFLTQMKKVDFTMNIGRALSGDRRMKDLIKTLTSKWRSQIIFQKRVVSWILRCWKNWGIRLRTVKLLKI